jgi:hypothetical protein
MASKPITVGTKTFNTLKDAKQHVRDLIERTPINTPLTGEDLDFVMELFKLHPEYEQKKGVGIRTIKVIHPVLYPKSKCFYITRVDGSGTDISWLTCFTKDNVRKDILNAFRYAVAYQIQDFRSEQLLAPQYCPYTGEVLDKLNSHVDHEAPLTFAKLVNDFMDGAELESVEITKPSDNQMITELVNPYFKRDWREYHLNNAKLRLISITANLSHAKRETL